MPRFLLFTFSSLWTQKRVCCTAGLFAGLVQETSCKAVCKYVYVGLCMVYNSYINLHLRLNVCAWIGVDTKQQICLCLWRHMVVRHVDVCVCVGGRCVCLCRFYVFVCVQFVHHFIYLFMRVSVCVLGGVFECVCTSHQSKYVGLCVCLWMCACLCVCVYLRVYLWSCRRCVERVLRVCARTGTKRACIYVCGVACVRVDEGWLCVRPWVRERTWVRERVCLSCGHVGMFEEDVVPAYVCMVVCTHVHVCLCMHMWTIHASNHTFIHVCIRVYLIGRMRVSEHVCMCIWVCVCLWMCTFILVSLSVSVIVCERERESVGSYIAYGWNMCARVGMYIKCCVRICAWACVNARVFVRAWGRCPVSLCMCSCMRRCVRVSVCVDVYSSYVSSYRPYCFLFNISDILSLS